MPLVVTLPRQSATVEGKEGDSPMGSSQKGHVARAVTKLIALSSQWWVRGFACGGSMQPGQAGTTTPCGPMV